MSGTNIQIIGGGIVGLSIARELLGRGADVTVFERGRVGRQASYVAGGMLAASAEVGFEEFDLYRLCSESLARWPAFAANLQEETGIDVDYRAEGSLIVAEDRDAAEALRWAFEFQREHGFNVLWLSAAEALEREPFLSPRIAAAVFAPEDHAVDNRQVIRALARSIELR
ncbi:MAG: FAD-dependent oxidoreductase, partial [Rhodothermales bacterium]|nr:FAD-dependent oxidoreductase [Rhodothermales bacterium]